jgi:type IV secretion system protein VirD4
MFKLARALLILTAILIGCCLAVIGLRFGVLFMAVAVILLFGVTTRRSETMLSAYGTARWADEQLLRLEQMIGAKDGVVIGRINEYRRTPLLRSLFGLLNPRMGSQEACERFVAAMLRRPTTRTPEVRLSKSVHSVFVSPTGAGKTTMIAIPFLKASPDSCVVCDFDGILAKETAEYRREQFGHRCVRLDPFKVATEKGDTLNPLSCIAKGSPLALDDYRDLANALVVRPEGGGEREPHWLDGAEFMIAVALLATSEAADEGRRSLQTVRTALASPEEYEALVRYASESPAFEGILSRMGEQMKSFVDRELGSTLTTANRVLRWLDSIPVRDSVMTSSFDPADLRSGKMTVYLILPLKRARVLAPLMRVWLSTLLRACVEGGPHE